MTSSIIFLIIGLYGLVCFYWVAKKKMTFIDKIHNSFCNPTVFGTNEFKSTPDKSTQ